MKKALMALAIAAASCGSSGGTPPAYEDALLSEAGNQVTVCSSRTDMATVAEYLTIPNRGDQPIEIRRVDIVDAFPHDLEVYVVAVPGEETSPTFFGTSHVDDVENWEEPLRAAWEERSTAPGVIPPGETGGLVVVLDPPKAPESMNYIFETDIELAVGDDSETYTYRSLRMIGSQQDCDELSSQLWDASS